MTSPRQQGNVIENRCCKVLQDLGYVTFCVRGSRGIVDVFAVHSDDELNRPHLAIQVGTKHKSIGSTLLLLLGERLPAGTIRIVARYIRKDGTRPYWLWHTTNGKATEIKALLAQERSEGVYVPHRGKRRSTGLKTQRKSIVDQGFTTPAKILGPVGLVLTKDGIKWADE